LGQRLDNYKDFPLELKETIKYSLKNVVSHQRL